MAAPKAIPILVCGKAEKIARGVIEVMKPEYEIIHIVMTPESGVEDIPTILKGETPAPRPEYNQVGSGNYSQKPVAIALGGGYTDEEFDKLYASARGVSALPWIKFDHSVTGMPPIGPQYGAAVAQRLKDKLSELESKGLFGKDDVYYY